MKNYKSPWAVIAVVVVFSIYFMLNSGSELFSVFMFDDNGNPTHSQTIQKVYGVELVQSFNEQTEFRDVIMQATYEAEEDENSAIFRAVVTNPFNTNADLKYIDVYKNDELLYRHASNKFMGPKTDFIYKTDLIDLTADTTKRNTILIQFIFLT